MVATKANAAHHLTALLSQEVAAEVSLWQCFSLEDSLDRVLLDRMARSGCGRLREGHWAIETWDSGVQSTLTAAAVVWIPS